MLPQDDMHIQEHYISHPNPPPSKGRDLLVSFLHSIPGKTFNYIFFELLDIVSRYDDYSLSLTFF